MARRTAMPAAGYALWLCAAAALLGWQYAPYLHTFVGTDVGVYWEVSRRLHHDDRLALFQNYFDNKTVVTYLWFLPFQRVAIAGHEMAGLKLAVYCLYLLCATLVFAALELVRDVGDARGARGGLVQGAVVRCLACAAFFASILSWADYAQNGVVSVGAISFAAAGLILLSACVLRDRGRAAAALGAGVLLGTAPFFRPEGGTGVCLAVALLATAAAADWKRVGARAALVVVVALATMALWGAVSLALGSDMRDVVDAVYTINLGRAVLRRSVTSVAAFFLQDRFLSGVAALLVATGALAAITAIAAPREPARRRRTLALTLAWGAYLLVQVGVSVYLRKIQSHYVLHFFLPVLFGTLWLTAVLGRAAWRATGPLVAGICLLIIVRVGVDRRGAVPQAVYRKAWASERLASTGVIADALSTLRAGVPRPRLLVLGDRANLYSLAAARGIVPYDWNTDGSLFQSRFRSADFFERWLARFRGDPPEFVVVVRSPDGPPGPRAARIEAVLATRYRRVDVARPLDSEWPYEHHYAYEVYSLRGAPAR